MSELDKDDLPSNLSENEHFQSVVDRVVNRRKILKTGLGLGAVAFLSAGLVGCGRPTNGLDNVDNGDSTDDDAQPTAETRLGFAAVATHSDDMVTVPPGYTAQALAPWGAALFADSPPWQDDGTNSASDQARQVGDNHDGMHFFPLDGESSEEGLLVVNHEYTNYEYLFGAEFTKNWSLDKVRKAQNAHGLSVLHVKLTEGAWEMIPDSAYNRRIHSNTPMVLTGPAAGHSLMVTAADPSGKSVLGTLNNCGNGFTPWGTYLAAEENFNGYFSGGNPDNPLHSRYGVPANDWGYRWSEFDSRFNAAENPNEPNRFGWVVEVDPFDPNSTPKKRTALGRFKHENIALTLTADKRVVVYSGDDQRFDYIYKFVSNGRYDPNNPNRNANLLDNGKLYVAKFNDGQASGDFMGTGQWILLDKDDNDILAKDDTFDSQADVLVKTRLAADAVGATKMDRPEWITVHPDTGEVYCTLTNNTRREATDTNDVNPRAENRYGQIVRWREARGNNAATRFEWDLFVLAGNPTAHPGDTLLSGSDNINSDNMFNSPDGLAFDSSGRLWIQTDGNFSNNGDFEGQGNNQMLTADPETKEIRRFLVGPSGCEITGITFTPNRTAMFINVQHPGQVGSHPKAPEPGGQTMDEYIAGHPTAFSKWPKSQYQEIVGGGRPRSATVVITKDDGGPIGT